MKKTRSDAVRNRERLLRVAYETFATEGLGVPIDEIARRAGVGAGTVYRHFPTKEALFRAIVADQFDQLIARARELAEAADPGAAFYGYFTRFIHEYSTDQGLMDAFAGSSFDIETAEPERTAEFKAALGVLLARAQQAGAVRSDVDVHDVKAMVIAGHAMIGYRGEAGARLIPLLCKALAPDA
ncbi:MULTISPECIES: TetR/AcrR family transcriptional regulator [unclassified Crossiella]|uniref:TetR/AcrR family transcriptional regulator n=1 Tax=unclassified Crossiella TaxID=2620835 RepID=UPI001FFE330C|nr:MULTISPECIES: TetR/AcrR family transcriptional regulator [unclassified Crossiella]MCK2241531.1 TetR/AcrR family transcriptional regulator [Crossiella sp. S99.2]MCK2255597.1 TetR/AcrR family transcriptional regulator [Crossiella sp. S99.1]